MTFCKKMYKEVTLLLILLLILFPLNAKASSYNKYFSITNEEYTNLINLGFKSSEIYLMSYEEYLENKDLVGEVVSTSINYYLTTTDLLTGKSNTEEVGEQQYNNHMMINTFALTPGYVETTGKKMTTTITSINDKYRYKIDLEWKNMPSTRSWDILGIGIESNKVNIYSTLTFQQNYCYTSGSCSSSGIFTGKISSSGGGVLFQLPSSTTINSLSSYLYFTVAKNSSSTITSLNAYGDYKHATSKVTNPTYTIGLTGIVPSSSFSSKYDAINVAQAKWTGSW